MGKELLPALDVQGQRMTCAELGGTHSWCCQVAFHIAGTPRWLPSWHRKCKWRKFIYIGVCGDWLGGPTKQLPASLAVLLHWAVFSSLFLNLPFDAGELWLRRCSSYCSALQPFSMPQDASLNIIEGSQGGFFCCSLSLRLRFSLEF